MKKRKVFFRADAGKEIGYGHFVRSLALADMLKEDFDCVFFTQTPSEYQRKEVSKICKLVELPSSDEKFNEFLEYLKGDEIVVLDNYFYTSEYQREIKDKGCKLVCIDDMHDKHYYADVVINHGLDDFTLFDIEPHTNLCLGFKWALLRKPFLIETANEREKGKWIISFGGSDPYNFTEKTVQKLYNLPNVSKIAVIIGNAYKYERSLDGYDNLEILKSISANQIADEFRSAEFALLSASGICLEALSCGCKVGAGYYVDNQKSFYKELVNNSFIYGIGNFFENLNNIDLSSLVDFNPSCKLDVSGVKERYINLFRQI